MKIPSQIRRVHVEEAFNVVRQQGVPAGRQSTKFDVLDDAGARFPPKHVLSLAAEIATAGHWEEDLTRERIGLPSLLPNEFDGLMHSTFMNFVVNGHKNPYYEWEKNRSDET